MFGKWRKHVDEQLVAIGENLRSLQSEFSRQSHTIEQGVQQLQSSVGKSEMAIGDLLDSWEEWQDTGQKRDDELRQARESEQNLLKLYEMYEGQLWGMRRLAKGAGGSWYSQLELMEQKLDKIRRTCAICEINAAGETVDYDVHEVIDTVVTQLPEKDKTVAEVYEPGYLYKGTVRKKARVAAWQLQRSTQEHE